MIAIKSGNKIIGNATRLRICGSGKKELPLPQKIMFEKNTPMLPFNAFEQAKVDVKKVEIIEHTGEEELLLPKQEPNRSGTPTDVDIYKRKDNKRFGKIVGVRKELLEKRHFLGAMLIQAENKQFLFDCDRNEVKHYRLNVFLSEIPKKCKTVKEAYEALKPEEVKKAEKKKQKVKRQGEWFFVPEQPFSEKETKSIQKVITKMKKMIARKYPNLTSTEIGRFKINVIRRGWSRRVFLFKKTGGKAIAELISEGRIQAGNNRPNNVEQMIIVGKKKSYAKGKITHSGREHEPITLKEWHIIYPNKACKSFTITGDVD